MVAIKTLKSTVTEDAIKNFEYEAELMAEITHENIVSLYGISYNGEHLMMIFEYMENRDLNNYLRYTSIYITFCLITGGKCKPLLD
jgi:serine/threonine protein kinase